MYKRQDGQKIKAGNDVTADKAVREALSIGIDRQKIIDNALNGIGKPAEGFTTNLEWGNPPSYEDGQTEKAAQILEDVYKRQSLCKARDSECQSCSRKGRGACEKKGNA